MRAKKRRPQSRRFFKGPSGLPSLLADFEVSAGLELNNLRSLDLDLFLRLGIDAHASLAFGDRESAETDKLKLLVLLNASLDRRENNIESRFGAGFRGVLAEEFLDFKNEFCFIHICFLLVVRGNLRRIYSGSRKSRSKTPDSALLKVCPQFGRTDVLPSFLTHKLDFFGGQSIKNIEIFLRPAARKSFPRKGRIAIRPQTPRATYEICARRRGFTRRASEPPFRAAPFRRSTSPRPPPKPRARAPRTCRRARRKCAPRKTAEFHPRRPPCARSLCRR